MTTITPPLTKVTLEIGDKRMCISTHGEPEDVSDHIANCGVLLEDWWKESQKDAE